MARNVFHRHLKTDARRIVVEANGAHKLNTGLRISRAGEFDFALLPFRKLSKGKRTIVQDIGVPYPMLFVIVSLREKPYLVAAVVEPFAVSWRKIFPGELRIDEKIWMSGEGHLYDAPTILGDDDQLNPAVR